MKIAVASYKGGVGKTSLSFSIAVDLNFRLITNDMSNVIQNYKNARYTPGKMPLYEDTVYDFGGFVDKNASEIIKECDYLVIPTIADANSMMKTLQVLSEHKDHPNILIVGNAVESKKDMDDINKIITHHFPVVNHSNIQFHYIRRTKLFKNALEGKKSATQLYHKDNFQKHIYKNGFKDYLALLKIFAKTESELGR